MAWQQKLTDTMTEFLRFCVRGVLLVNGILLAAGSVYFIAKLVWFTVRFMDRTMFSKPW